jgi:hypothetical protein
VGDRQCPGRYEHHPAIHIGILYPRKIYRGPLPRMCRRDRLAVRLDTADAKLSLCREQFQFIAVGYLARSECTGHDRSESLY